MSETVIAAANILEAEIKQAIKENILITYVNWNVLFYDKQLSYEVAFASQL